jgi:hypothetical protein
MRTSIIKVVLASLLVCSGAVYGAGLADYEKTCLDLGFKKRTPAYGECVLELDKRSTDQHKQGELARVEQQRQAQEQQRQAQEQQERQAAQQRQQRQQQEQQRAARGDGTPDHSTCAGFGFIAGTAPYADCRMRVSFANRAEEVRQQNERAAAEQSVRLAAERRAAENGAKEVRRKRQNFDAYNVCLATNIAPHLNCNRWQFCGIFSDDC